MGYCNWIRAQIGSSHFFNFTLNSLLIINLAVWRVLRAAANKELRTPAMRNYPMAFALYPKKYILIILFPAYSSVLSLSTAKIQSIDDNIITRFIFEFFYFNHLLLTQVSIKTNNVDCFCLLFRRWFLPGSSKFIFLQWDYFFKHSKMKRPVSKPTQIQRTHFLYWLQFEKFQNPSSKYTSLPTSILRWCVRMYFFPIFFPTHIPKTTKV